MAKFYFKKENLRPEIRDAEHKVIVWEATAGDVGLLALEESDPLVAQLNSFADERVGGVVRISAEIYEAQKKSEPLISSRRPLNHLNQIRISNPPQPFGQPDVASVVAEDNGRPLVLGIDPNPPSRRSFVARTQKINAAAKAAEETQ